MCVHVTGRAYIGGAQDRHCGGAEGVGAVGLFYCWLGFALVTRLRVWAGGAAAGGAGNAGRGEAVRDVSAQRHWRQGHHPLLGRRRACARPARADTGAQDGRHADEKGGPGTACPSARKFPLQLMSCPAPVHVDHADTGAVRV